MLIEEIGTWVGAFEEEKVVETDHRGQADGDVMEMLFPEVLGDERHGGDAAQEQDEWERPGEADVGRSCDSAKLFK